jgi:hypothetical protein
MINKIGLILGVVGLVLCIIMASIYYKEKKNTRDLIAKGEQALVDIENKNKIREDSIALEISKRDSAIKSLSKAQQVAKESLNSALKTSKGLSIALREAKVLRDTTKYYEKCDSLSEHIAVVEAENQSYQEKVDQLNLSYTKQLADKDALIRSKDELYGKLREAFNGSTLKINELNEEKHKLNLKLEKSKRTSRLIAVLGAVAAGTVFIATR